MPEVDGDDRPLAVVGDAIRPESKCALDAGANEYIRDALYRRIDFIQTTNHGSDLVKG